MKKEEKYVIPKNLRRANALYTQEILKLWFLCKSELWNVDVCYRNNGENCQN